MYERFWAPHRLRRPWRVPTPGSGGQWTKGVRYLVDRCVMLSRAGIRCRLARMVAAGAPTSSAAQTRRPEPPGEQSIAPFILSRSERHHSEPKSSIRTPRPACRLARASSIRRRKRGSVSSRYSNQSSSEAKPISTPAGLPCRVMTISCFPASRKKRDRPSFISDRGTFLT